MVDGLPLVAGWAASGVAMAALVRAATHRLDAEVALGGVAVQLGLALGHTLVYDAPLSSAGAGADLVAGVAVALVAAGCFASARIAGAALAPLTRTALEGTALVLVAYLAAVVLSGPALTLTWAAEAVALAALARRHRDPLARAGAVGFLGVRGAARAAGARAAGRARRRPRGPAGRAGAARRRRRGAGGRAHARRRPAPRCWRSPR